MRRQDILKRLECLSKEYNDLSSQLLAGDSHESNENVEVIKKEVSAGDAYTKVAEYESTIEKLKKEAKEGEKEVKFLKDLLRRCNDQLNRYMLRNGEISPCDHLRTEAGDAEITRQSVYKLSSLLVAYDEVINEQRMANMNLTDSVEDSFKKIKVLEEENKKFYEVLKAFNKEGYNEGELRQIAEEAKLLIEEREALLAEADLLQERETQLKQTYEKKLDILEVKLREEKDLSKSLREEVNSQQAEIDDLQKKTALLQEQLKSCIAEEDHKQSVEECSRYLEKLKEAYGNESSHMRKKVDTIKEEKRGLEDRLNQSSKQLKGMKKEVGGYKTYLRKNHSLVYRQRKQIEALSAARRNYKAKLRSLSHICSKLLEDRKRLVGDLKAQKAESSRFSREAVNKSAVVGQLRLKYKKDHLDLKQRLAETEGKLRVAQEAWSKSDKDVMRLKRLLQSKEDTLRALLSDLRYGMAKKSFTRDESFK